MATERFEMRIDSELLARLDNWRGEEEDSPSRAEAIRRLIDAGLAHDNKGKPVYLSDGEKLITTMLADVIKGLNIETETNIDLVKNVHLSVHPPEGRVTLVAPSGTRLEVARAYAISRLGWIRDQNRDVAKLDCLAHQ